MKKVITTLTAVAFALGLAGAGIAQTASKDAAKPAVKMETSGGQAQVAPKATDKPGEVAKPGAKEEVKPGEKAQPVTKDVTKPGVKEKGKKSTKAEKKAGQKADCPVDKTQK